MQLNGLTTNTIFGKKLENFYTEQYQKNKNLTRSDSNKTNLLNVKNDGSQESNQKAARLFSSLFGKGK